MHAWKPESPKKLASCTQEQEIIMKSLLKLFESKAFASLTYFLPRFPLLWTQFRTTVKSNVNRHSCRRSLAIYLQFYTALADGSFNSVGHALRINQLYAKDLVADYLQ